MNKHKDNKTKDKSKVIKEEIVEKNKSKQKEEINIPANDKLQDLPIDSLKIQELANSKEKLSKESKQIDNKLNKSTLKSNHVFYFNLF